jgi:hypothetical protein
MSEQLTPLGLYERVLDEELAELLKSCPDITATLEKLDDESEVESYSQLIAHILRGVLPNTTPKDRLPLINRLIELLSAQDGLDYTLRRRLIAAPKTLLTQA